MAASRGDRALCAGQNQSKKGSRDGEGGVHAPGEARPGTWSALESWRAKDPYGLLSSSSHMVQVRGSARQRIEGGRVARGRIILERGSGVEGGEVGRARDGVEFGGAGGGRSSRHAGAACDVGQAQARWSQAFSTFQPHIHASIITQHHAGKQWRTRLWGDLDTLNIRTQIIATIHTHPA